MVMRLIVFMLIMLMENSNDGDECSNNVNGDDNVYVCLIFNNSEATVYLRNSLYVIISKTNLPYRHQAALASRMAVASSPSVSCCNIRRKAVTNSRVLTEFGWQEIRQRQQFPKLRYQGQ